MLAKTTFLSNIFPIPKKMLQEIHKSYLNTYGKTNHQNQYLGEHYFYQNTNED